MPFTLTVFLKTDFFLKKRGICFFYQSLLRVCPTTPLNRILSFWTKWRISLCKRDPSQDSVRTMLRIGFLTEPVLSQILQSLRSFRITERMVWN